LIDVGIRFGSAMEINHQDEEFKVPVLEHVSRNQKGCTLCEEYMTETLDYLGENKTQTMVIDILHDGCSRARSLRQEVRASLFFS
jgi:saposin